MPSLAEIVAKNLAQLLSARDLNQQDLANLTGLHRNTVRQYLEGTKKGIKPAILERLAKGLEVDVGALVNPGGPPREIHTQISELEALEMIRKKIKLTSQIPQPVLERIVQAYKDEDRRRALLALLGLRQD